MMGWGGVIQMSEDQCVYARWEKNNGKSFFFFCKLNILYLGTKPQLFYHMVMHSAGKLNIFVWIYD